MRIKPKNHKEICDLRGHNGRITIDEVLEYLIKLEKESKK